MTGRQPRQLTFASRVEVPRHDLTPIEHHGPYTMKRDDLFAVAGSCGGKVRTCLALARGASGLVTAGSRQSPQVNIVATIARHLGIPARVHVPEATGPYTPELAAAVEHGATIVGHRPGYNTVIVARARDDATATGYTEIPFGMEHPVAVELTAAQVANIPPDTRRIVVPVGSGMSLAGILAGLVAHELDIPVVGVVVGADPTRRLDTYAPAGWDLMANLIPAGMDYHASAPSTTLEGVPLDPIYEAKCIPHLTHGDLLWIVGRRATLSAAPEGSSFRGSGSRRPGKNPLSSRAGMP